MSYTRRFTPGDITEVVAMARRFHAESPVHNEFVFDEEKVVNLIASSASDSSWLPLLACDDDGAIIGMALMYAMPMFFSLAREAGDLAFYVEPSKRGTRAAPLMLKAISEWAYGQGVRRITIALHTGINHDIARRFFEKSGFEVSGIMLAKSVH